jgi:hypothetical protein
MKSTGNISLRWINALSWVESSKTAVIEYYKTRSIAVLTGLGIACLVFIPIIIYMQSSPDTRLVITAVIVVLAGIGFAFGAAFRIFYDIRAQLGNNYNPRIGNDVQDFLALLDDTITRKAERDDVTLEKVIVKRGNRKYEVSEIGIEADKKTGENHLTIKAE